MNNQQIINLINYIKTRSEWEKTLRDKSRAISQIISGLFRFGSFLAYWVVERYFLKNEIEMLYLSNPNWKYMFWLSLAFGILGLVNSAIGAWKYLQNSQKADLLKYQTEELEKKLLEDKLWGN